MPRKSKKNSTLELIAREVTIQMMDVDSDDDDSDDDLDQNDFDMDMALALSCKFASWNAVPKQTMWLTFVLTGVDELRFKEAMRMTHAQFNNILELIKENPIFQTTDLQMPVSVQLALVLYRFGVYGSAASVRRVAALFGVGDGATVIRITRRVIKAILDLEGQVIYWPDEAEREEMVREYFEELPFCIGFVDGTPVNIEEAPHIDRDSYFDKNRRYSLKLQLICDHKKRIRHYIVGSPGSVHDSRVWNTSDMGNHPEKYFSGDQYICGDMGYTLKEQVMTPHRENSTELSPADRKKFNKFFSSCRVKIEHVNGSVKETYASLKELRIRIRDGASLKEATDWIRAILILYNINLPLDNYIPKNIQRLNNGEDEEYNEYDFVMNQAAQKKRIELVNYLLSR